MSEKPSKRWWCSALMTERDRRNNRRFNVWLILWALTYAGGLVGLKLGWFGGGATPWIAAIAPDILGVIAAVKYVQFLHDADELLRKVQVEGLAIGFGAGAIFMIGYQLLELAGAPRASVSDPFPVMMAFWVIGQWIGMRRYA